MYIFLNNYAKLFFWTDNYFSIIFFIEIKIILTKTCLASYTVLLRRALKPVKLDPV